MKKVYIAPSVDTINYNVKLQFLTGSISGDTPGDKDPGYGGIDDGDHELDVKGESWTNIWE